MLPVDDDHPAPCPLRPRADCRRQRYLPNASPTCLLRSQPDYQSKSLFHRLLHRSLPPSLVELHAGQVAGHPILRVLPSSFSDVHALHVVGVRSTSLCGPMDSSDVQLHIIVRARNHAPRNDRRERCLCAATQSRTVTFRRTSHLRCYTGGAHWRRSPCPSALPALPARVGNAGDNPVGLPHMAK